jgi:ADP-ribose pyrophosphatase
MKPWKRIEPTIVSKVGWRTVISKVFELPNGIVHNFETVGAEGSLYVGVIALTPDNKVVIARQFRPGPEKVMEEIPGGGLEPGEEPEAAARRELQEETGYVPEAMEHLGIGSRDSFTNSKWHYFLGTGCTLSGEGQHLDSTEIVDVDLISIEELIQNARNDGMTDQTAVLLAYEKLRAIQAKT